MQPGCDTGEKTLHIHHPCLLHHRATQVGTEFFEFVELFPEDDLEMAGSSVVTLAGDCTVVSTETQLPHIAHRLTHRFWQSVELCVAYTAVN